VPTYGFLTIVSSAEWSSLINKVDRILTLQEKLILMTDALQAELDANTAAVAAAVTAINAELAQLAAAIAALSTSAAPTQAQLDQLAASTAAVQAATASLVADDPAAP